MSYLEAENQNNNEFAWNGCPTYERLERLILGLSMVTNGDWSPFSDFNHSFPDYVYEMTFEVRSRMVFMGLV
jgi:hypothetical protein